MLVIFDPFKMLMKPVYFYLFALLTCLTCSCSVKKYTASNKVYKSQSKAYARIFEQTPPLTPGQADSINLSADWAGTVNFNLRKPNYVIIHHTAQDTIDQTLKTFTLKSSEVSAHYVIANNGTVYHMLNDYMRAYHAGVSKWGNDVDINSASIGIELDNNGSEPFSEAQVNSLVRLLANLKKLYNIPTANFIGHADVAPKRKTDPSALFPWKKLADKGFGLWYSDSLETAPVTLDPAMALRIIGYDTSDLKAAITAFKRHFIQTDLDPVLTQRDLDVLNNLYRKYF